MLSGMSKYSVIIFITRRLLVDRCRAIMAQLINDQVPQAPRELFYGLGMPIYATFQGLDAASFTNGRIIPVPYRNADFIAKARDWCEGTAQDGEGDNPFLRQRCASAAWIVSLLDHDTFYNGPNLRNNFYIPTQREFTARASWTMGAAALIAQAQNSGLKGCANHVHGLEVMGIFNGSTDGIEDALVDPAIQPAFDDESYDEVFTADTQLIKSSDVPSSAKFIHSLSDNNFITAQVSLSFANFALFAVILVAISAWVYRRALRRASPTTSLAGDMVKV